MRISGSRWAATAATSTHIHAAGIVFHLHVEEARSTSATPRSRRTPAEDLGARHAEDRAVQKNIFAPGKIRMKTCADFQQRGDSNPRSRTRPVLGSVMRESIFSSVDLPAPLRPTMPMTSPRSISNDTSRNLRYPRRRVSQPGKTRAKIANRPHDRVAAVRARSVTDQYCCGVRRR